MTAHPVELPRSLPTRREGRSRRRRVLAGIRDFLRASPVNVVGSCLVALVVLMAILGPLVAPYDPAQLDLVTGLQGPTAHHLFGTDNLGRDIFSEVIYGARVSLGVAFIVLSLSVTLGTILGIIAGLLGGLADEIIMRVTDLFLAFPAFILAAAIAATLGPSLQNTVLALAIVFWPWYARLVRGQVLTLREREFVLASRLAGGGPMWIATRHLFKNVLPILVVQGSMDVGYAILAVSSLSFLGLGAQPPTPEWGALITGGRDFIEAAWWWATFPGLALSLTVVGFNLLGDGLRDWIDPRLRGSIGGDRP